MDDPQRGAADPAPSPSYPPAPPRPHRLLDRKTARATGALFLVTPLLGYFAWWRSVERTSFNFANERWFERDTYAGGADKASHIVLGYMGTQLLQSLYKKLGHSPEESRLLAFSAAAITGALVELGDGFSQYGYSWEDIASNAIGSLAATVVDRFGLDDTVGFRYGIVKALKPDLCCRYGGYGSDYSKEVYSADVKLAGLLSRIGLRRAGPAKFFLLSLTYGSKGYRYSPEEVRERNVGIELGLNFPAILRALGVKDSSWWGRPLLVFLTYFRFPYTSFGFHYDLNHGRWNGIDTGDRFDPGSIFYD